MFEFRVSESSAGLSAAFGEEIRVAAASVEGAHVFEYRKGRTVGEVAALFGDGVTLADRTYVEDTETGSLLVPAGGDGPENPGGSYVLRWHGRAIGVDYRITRRDDEHGDHALFTLSGPGASHGALLRAKVPLVDLTPEDATRALHVAAEACVVYESHRADYGPGARVTDPLDPARELSPADFGYGEIAPVTRGAR
ncbi:hypothetical protein J1G43_18315 [Cellulomonas sp. zg-ZUI22]|uniref:hypothetical protein n=1 Tax=Cellulomonas sp. zg-ZUI22 TaxID=2816955 RepID=UPI001A946070|nr:hypothetical protein [Cellulomonas sp. zg-ZUI22]MBO0901919.1 hypothetical protein [Cellulomonas sp. zg-ZUI22]